ncbi:MAG: hypothetical protein DDT40_00760 [candidate division WS2 bacterium]|nr:hypothetical protein [Candidatus Psychracetigena formicireducens]
MGDRSSSGNFLDGDLRKAKLWRVILTKKEFLEVLPDKHLTSYVYAISQLPNFLQAQHMGVSPIDEILNRYSIQDNIMGITKEDIKVILDNITNEVNKAREKSGE